MDRRTQQALTFTFLLGLSGTTALAQPLAWATRAGGTSLDNGISIAADDDGNNYVIGFFEAAATFGAGEPNETVLIGAGGGDIFVAKYDGSGSLLWASRAGGGMFDRGTTIAIDENGNCFLAGDFEGVATFGVGETNETVLTSAGSRDTFVAKYDASGSLLWATRAGGTDLDAAWGVALEVTGPARVTGYFTGTAVFGAGEPNETVLTSRGETDLFVAEYDSSGLLTWVIQAGGTDFATSWGIDLDDAGNSCITGYFTGTATFGAGEPNETVLTSAGNLDAFVAKYDGSGSLVWATRVGGVEHDWGTAIAVNGVGTCYATGFFGATAVLGPGEPNETMLTSAGSSDAYVARYAASGLLAWATRAGGTNVDSSSGVAAGDTGAIAIIGSFRGTAAFGAGEPNKTELTSAGNRDVFVAEYDHSGLLVAATRAGGISADTGGEVAVDGAGHLYSTGRFEVSAVFGAGEPNETELTSAGESEVYVAKFVAVAIFTDGFESGNTSAWSGTVPSRKELR